MTLVEMLERNARLFPGKTAIVYKGRKISYRALDSASSALAAFLLQHGFQKGDRAGLLVRKTPEAIISFLGAAKAGGIVFPIDYTQTTKHIQTVLDITQPAALVVSRALEPLLVGSRTHCPDDKIIVVDRRPGGRHPSWREVMDQGAAGVHDVEIKDEDVVYLNFTSGTTGSPKGALSTHANIYWNALSAIESLGLTRDDVHLCGFPVFGHPHELFARALYLGGTVILTDDALPGTIAQAVSTHGVTCMMAIAPIYENLLRYRVPASALASVRVAESGGMPTPAALAREFERYFHVPLVPVWGSTETTGIALAASVGGGCRPGAMGKPCPRYEVKIIGASGEELDAGATGEMLVRGPAVCSGYYNNAGETAKHMRDGWFFTGDLARKDGDGGFFFVGRKTGMMKVAGHRVFPSEIEGVLLAHPYVAEAAVVKIQDDILGEAPKAVVVVKNAAKINGDDLRTYCARHLPRHKVPAVVELAAALPENPDGGAST